MPAFKYCMLCTCVVVVFPASRSRYQKCHQQCYKHTLPQKFFFRSANPGCRYGLFLLYKLDYNHQQTEPLAYMYQKVHIHFQKSLYFIAVQLNFGILSQENLKTLFFQTNFSNYSGIKEILVPIFFSFSFISFSLKSYNIPNSVFK